ncbi:related to glycosyl transferase [Phialocephala subalpina]|uniref:Related to glycosyl transferase n=1 Tax=Phialocephala subalpina TaxID=576137 RepID=A0A1L7XCT4_9HELO|nr:related to glycosyl transferase [Phialocephala subalpina]
MIVPGGRLSKELRRALPIYVACVLFILFFARVNPYESPLEATEVIKRVLAAYQTPLQTTKSLFPRKIWQTWKVAPVQFQVRDLERARSWAALNPGHRYEVMTDGNDLHYVETHFGPGPGGLNRPDIVNMYRSLNATIIKADLLRYLMMYIEGGVYADIDVEALKPVDQFIPSHLNEEDVDLVISVEIDEPSYANHTILGQKSRSFCQWTFMCKPRVPVLLRLVDHILGWLERVATKQGVPIGEIVLNFDEVITGTGPSAFTELILAEMTRKTGRAVTWDSFHALTEPKLVGNILVLTVDSFAAGQGHSNALTHDSPRALVKHHYHASLWPSRHPRYSHPAYGMVEECNWERECVDAWDANTAAYPSLPAEEQERLIAAHQAALKANDDKEAAENAAHEAAEKDRKQSELLEACAAEIRGWLPKEEANAQAAEATKQAEATQTQPTEAAQTQPPEANQTQPAEATQTQPAETRVAHTDLRSDQLGTQ